MAVEYQQNRELKIPDTHPVVVAGAGPVGLVASLLLCKYQVPHLLVEQLSEIDDHPQAHFINRRSMEILRELDSLDQVIQTSSAPAAHWRRFVYCTDLSGLPDLQKNQSNFSRSLLGMIDHFHGVSDEGHSPVRVTHFPQHHFVRLLRAQVKQSPLCSFVEGSRVEIRETSEAVTVTLNDCLTGQRRQVQAQFVIAADGAHSSIRSQLGIEPGSRSAALQHLANVHFFSPQLSERLRTRIPAMLYFIYFQCRRRSHCCPRPAAR